MEGFKNPRHGNFPLGGYGRSVSENGNFFAENGVFCPKNTVFGPIFNGFFLNGNGVYPVVVRYVPQLFFEKKSCDILVMLVTKVTSVWVQLSPLHSFMLDALITSGPCNVVNI